MFNLLSLKNSLANVQGFYCDGVNVGMRSDNPNQGDVAYIRSEVPCDVSAVFTSNKFQAAPLQHYQRYPKDFQSDFILINAKNANAMTGERGIKDIDTIFDALRQKQKVLNPIMSSTGVIGYPLPIEKITSSFDTFDFHAKHADKTAKAIMTTDSFQKELCFKVELEDGESFTIAAICKGAGMINPAMATMLCFIITDANIPKADMDELLAKSAEQSFNTISVDGDTSTNDSVIMMANKLSQSYDKAAFAVALNRLTKELSQLILRDGEGSNKVVAFHVSGAESLADAKKASQALSNSLLVKTALFGEDPNWGRIASTIGASGIACDADKLVIKYDNLLIYSSQSPILDEAKEAKANEIMKKESYSITCDIGLGDFSYTSYGCDLSYEYVKINADYRT